MDALQMRKLLFVLIITSLAHSGYAQLTLNSVNEAIQFALQHNYERQMQQLKVEQARDNKVTANAFYYPGIMLGANGQYNIDISETPVPGELVGQPGETVYMAFGKKYTYTAGINVNYNLLNWTSVYQSKIASNNVKLAQANSDYYEQKLKETVGQNYSAVLTAIQAEKLWKRNVLVADTIEMLTKKKFEEGLSDQLSVNQSVISRIQAEQQLEKTQLYSTQITNQLKTALGLKVNDEIVFTEMPEQEKIEADGTVLLPDKYVEVLKLQEAIAGYEMKSALSAFAPQVSLKGYFGANQFSNQFDFSFDSQNWRKSNYLGVSVTMPLFTGFANKSKYESAKTQRKIAQTARNQEQEGVQLRDNNLNKQYLSAISIANTSYQKLTISEENLILARQKYEQGLISLMDYMEFFNLHLSVQNQYLTDLSEYRSVQATINSRK